MEQIKKIHTLIRDNNILLVPYHCLTSHINISIVYRMLLSSHFRIRSNWKGLFILFMIFPASRQMYQIQLIGVRIGVPILFFFQKFSSHFANKSQDNMQINAECIYWKHNGEIQLEFIQKFYFTILKLMGIGDAIYWMYENLPATFFICVKNKTQLKI